MKIKRSLSALTLVLVLISYIGPAAQAMPARPAAAEGDLIPQEIASVPGATQDWWAGVQEQIRQDMYDISPDEGQDEHHHHHDGETAAGEKGLPHASVNSLVNSLRSA